MKCIEYIRFNSFKCNENISGLFIYFFLNTLRADRYLLQNPDSNNIVYIDLIRV